MNAALVVLVACLTLVGSGCHWPACADIDYDAGERFQLTVVRRQTTFDPHCDFAALAPGDTLTIVAGDLTTESDGCGVRAARPEVPAFAKDLVSMCEAEPRQLGQVCRGTTSPTMGCMLSTFVSTSIRHDDQSFEGRVDVHGSGACAPSGFCSDLYDVHIERLPQSP